MNNSLEEILFKLAIDELIKEEGEKAIEENERLKKDSSFIIPKETHERCIATINKHFNK